jgi:methyl-accepting chemotaxis protein
MLFLILHEEADREKFFKRYTSLLEQISILDERIRLPEARTILYKIESNADELLPIGKSLIEIHESDIARTGRFETERHRELIKRFYEASSAVRKNGVKLAEFNIDSETEKKDRAINNAASIQQSILMVMVTAVIMALAFGYAISRAIAKPIIKFKDAAVEIGKGKLDTKVGIKSNDEIGKLAATFNKMTEDLKMTTVSRDLLAKEIEERERVEEERERLLRDTEKVNRELKDFAYIVSHDLKAPLRAISQLSHWILGPCGKA